MRRVALAALLAWSMGGCRPYDYSGPVTSQDGLIPAAQFARYGRDQAEAVAIGRAFSEWKVTSDSAGLAEQADRTACFARRFKDIETVDADPLGHRLTVRFSSGWRAAVLPIPDGVAPGATPGISPLGESPCK